MADTPAAPLRSLLIVSSCILGILVVAGLFFARAVLLPLAIAILLTFILTPLVVRLQRGGVPRTPAVILVSTLGFLVLGGFAVLIAMQVHSLAVDLPQYRENISKKAAALRSHGPGNFFEKIQRAITDINEELSGANSGDPGRKPWPVEIHEPGPARFEAIASPVLSMLTTFALVGLLVIFMLAKHEDLRDRLIRLIGHGRLTDTTRALEDASKRVSRFLQMQLTINLCFGLTLGLGLLVIGVPQAILWGLLVGALRFVPYLGSPFGGLLLILLSVAIFPGWTEPLAVLGVFVVLELVTANVLEPVIFGHSTGLSPLALLVAAAFWTWLWGPAGLLLSTPLTVCLVILGRYVPGLEFFGVLLSDRPALTLGQRYYQRLLAHDPDEAIDLIEEHLKAHPAEPFYDAVLLPALVLVQRDHERGTLSAADKQAVLRDMGQILEEMVPVRCPIPREPGAVVFGIPTQEGDELALAMLGQLLAGEGCRLKVIPTGTRVDELVAQMAEEQPAGVCIASLPPAGMAEARYLCKRLRAQFPELKILVGRWGQKEGLEQMRERVKAAGADEVGTTLLESRIQVLPLLQEDSVKPREPRTGAAAVAGVESR